MSEFLLIWLGAPILTALAVLIYLKHKESKFRISKIFHHEALVGAQCTCGVIMMSQYPPKFVLSYEDKQEEEEYVQYWIAEHRKEHATAG